MSKLPANVVAWQTRGKTCTIGGVEIFYRDVGGTSSDAVLFLHGFPSSSYDWHALCWLWLVGKAPKSQLFAV